MNPALLNSSARGLAGSALLAAAICLPVHAQTAPDAPTRSAAGATPTDARLPAVTVTGTREKALLTETPASVGLINARTIRETAPTHPQQLLGQVPGVAIGVTNGEGHNTAIRQPFTTAPLYLYLEDGLPIRATGFFNHNALYELNLPMAGGVEVVRGPGTALYGSDAIGGIINLITRLPGPVPGAALNAEAGSHGWRRLMAEGDTGAGAWGAMRADLNLTRTDGWRDRTAYERNSGNFRWDAAPSGTDSLKTILSFSQIDQQTGANSPLPYADYRNNPTRNNLSIAFRQVDALRLSTAWERVVGNGLLSVTPYFRDNRMDLLASFTLASDPTLATTSNLSYGVAAKWRQDFAPSIRGRVIAGIDLENSPGSRIENRLNVTSTGSGASRVFTAYTSGTRIFDYDVTFRSSSPYLHTEFSPLDRLRVSAGVRYDHLSYSVNNRFGSAPVRDAASGNWYGQSGDATLNFERLSPKIGATWAFEPRTHGYLSYNTGFRAPSESQLFRPSLAANATDATHRATLSLGLKPIKAEQAEIGLRGERAGLDYNLAAFHLVKRDDLVSQRDLATNLATNVNAGRTRHQGLELGVGARLDKVWRIDGAFSYTRHTYVDWVSAAADFSGKEMEAAPRTLANLRVSWMPRPRALAQLEWVHLGAYWLEASNSATYARYPGHNLVNARLAWPISEGLSVFARVMNLADRRYADSASVSSNTPVYSPGLPRTLYAGFEAKW